MKKYRYTYEPDSISMPALSEGTLFLDIETTGFDRRSTFLTIIGLAWQEKEQIIVEQWLNETGPMEEPLLLLELNHFLKEMPALPQLIHYNGSTFDLPYLKAKYDQYHLPTSLCDCNSTDLYKLAKKYKKLFGLSGIRQKNLDEFFGLYREDTLSGQELINVYLEGIESKDETLLHAYLLHNKEDMEGMVYLQNLLKLHSFLNGEFLITEWTESKDHTWINVTLTGDYYLYKPVLCSMEGIDFKLCNKQTDFKIPVKYMEAKYFYPNYKDYYYLPAENCAMHKSVASYVEKDYRQKATKETCYTRKTSSFVPLPLPAATRCRKMCLQECSCLDLFYESYGDCMAWVEQSLEDNEKRQLYIKILLHQLTVS